MGNSSAFCYSSAVRLRRAFEKVRLLRDFPRPRPLPLPLPRPIFEFDSLERKFEALELEGSVNSFNDDYT